jgi:VCBS repeat-containing protein
MMASKHSFSRRQLIARKQGRSRRLLLEHLEDRLSPAANLLVTTSIAVTEQVLREYTPSGDLVRTVSLPATGSYEPGRDLIYDQSGQVHAYLGTFDPALGSYTLAGGGWTERTHAGWSTVNNVSNGGIGQWGDYVYVTDMTTFVEPADIAKGVVRFNLADGTSARFLEAEEPQDLAIGHDGNLYLLSGSTVKSYDRETFQQLDTVTLPTGDFRGIAVNAAGEIFAVNFSEQVYRLNSSGAVLDMVTLSEVSDPMDIDLSGDGRVAIGTASGHVVQMSESLTGLSTFAAGTQRAFVAFGPDESQSPAGPTPPTATITSDVIVAEGNSGTSQAVFTVTLSAPSVDPVVFKYTASGITAEVGSDFWFTNETRVLLPGQTSAQLFVPILGDTTFEDDETLTLTLSDPVGVTLTDTSRQITITNDDLSTPYFIVDDVSQSEGGQFAGTIYSFLVKLSTPSSQTVTVNYTTGNDTALAGSDYNAKSGTLTFAPGQLQQAVDVTVLGDLAPEPDETFFLELSGATNADITDSQAVGTIVNDDSLYQLSLDDAFGFEGDGQSATVEFTVTLNQTSTTPITVDYLTYAADATDYVDFVPSWGTVIFAPGETSQIVSVPIIGDTEIEPDETFYLVLQNPSGAALSNDYALGTIGNDDSYEGNNAPIAANDAYELMEDYPLSVFGPGVLENDYDPDSGSLQALLISGPAHGTLYFDAGGSFTYAPDENYIGPDSFIYRATDGGGLSALATVSLTVWGSDDPIDVVAPETATTAEDTPLTFSWTTENPFFVTDVDSPQVMVTLLAQNGILTLPSTDGLEFPDPNSTNNGPYITFYADNPDEANAALDGLIVTPAANFNGTTYLDILVTDLGSIYSQPSDYATVTINVTPVNDAPTAVDDYYEGAEDNPLTVSSFGVFANDYDVDGGFITAELASGPAHGTVTLHPWGAFTYTPAPNYFGPDSFTYRTIDDGGLASAPATVSLYIWGMDDPIQAAAPGPQTIDEDTTITFSTAGGNAFSVADVESPRVIVDLLVQEGILTLPSTAGLEFPEPGSMNNSPSIRFYADNPAEANAALDGLIFTPDANFNGQTNLTLLVRDTTILYPPVDAFAYTQITVNAVNDAPVAVDDSYAAEAGAPFFATLEGGGHGLGVLTNDQDVDWDTITAVLVSGPGHGTLEFNPDGTFTYTADNTYSGTDSFTYRASDGQLESGLATATFTVTQVNHAPMAVSDSFSVDEDGVLSIVAPGVFGNDWDDDGDTLAATLVSGPAYGVLNLNADGSFTYTPSANYHGSDSFRYKASDGQAESNIALVSITVNAVNDAPLAVNDAYSLNEDQTLTIAPVPGVTSLTMVSEPGDYIGQGQTYSYTPATGTFYANRNFDNGVSIFYAGGGHNWHLDFAAPFSAALTPGFYANATRWPFQDASVPGLDVSGDGRGSNTLTGNFTVTEAVYAADGDVLRFAATFEQHSEGIAPALTGTININQGGGDSGVLLNDSDIEGSPLTIIVVTTPEHGTLSMNVDGSFAYTPLANYHGADSFSYKLTDGTSESNVATVSLTVNSVNDFPTAVGDSYTVAEDSVLSVAAPGVLANDFDVDGDSLTATLVTSTTHGSLAFNTDGSFTYTPQANFHGADSFQYAARDGSSFSFIRTVTLDVTSVNDAPVAAGDSYQTTEDTPLTVPAVGVLGNDSDVEGTALSAVLVTGPAHGTLTQSADGSFTYTPSANYHGTDSFTYRASDGSADSNIATVSLTISAVNDAPTAADDAYFLGEDQSLTIAGPGVLAGDSDVDGEALSALLVGGPAHGTLNLNVDGSFTYTPNADYHGSDSFTYRASDGSLESSVATVTLTIAPVNDAPTADAGADQTAAEGSTVSFTSVTSDAEGDTLDYLWDFGDGATATDAAPTHAYADNGVYTVTLTVSDGQGGVRSDSLIVMVNNVAPTLSLSGASAVNEASAYTLNLAASDPGADTIANWTIDWGDGAVDTVAGNPGSVSHTYADGTQTYSISATASDEDGTYSAASSQSVTVSNVAPTASLGGPATGARGQERNFALGAADPSPIDQAAAFTFNIDWGDGSSQTSTGPASQQLSHTFAAVGTFTVQITATDQDGGVSTTAQHTITINAVDLQAGTLVIGGTTADDSITVSPTNSTGTLAVTINGVSQGTFASAEQIIIYGQAGHDQLKLNTKKIGPTTYHVTVPAVIFGDAGNDTLDARGSSANNILVGGAGTDSLQGGSGRELLLGCLGADTLRGNGGDDLLIGNVTDFDSNLDALIALLAEWGRTDASYQMRIDHISGSGGGGLNGGYFLSSDTVHDDAAIDQLDGDAGTDWFFYTANGSNKDRLNDLVIGEVATEH